MDQKVKSAGVWPTITPFVNGSMSGMLAICVFQPIDMVKVRIQLGPGSVGQVTITMLKNKGFGAFYKYDIGCIYVQSIPSIQFGRKNRVSVQLGHYQ